MLKRIFYYLSQMYPLSSWLGTFLTGFMVLTLSWRLGRGDESFEWFTLVGPAALCFFSLLLRVKDEFKDYEDDLRNFPQRPLPSGKVTKRDLKFLGWFCVVAALGLSAWDEEVFAMACGVLIYSYLMLKWFFREEQMRASLPLAFLTHHPVVLLHFGYLIAVNQTTAYAVTPWQRLALMPLALIMTNWEICRKLRHPKDETAYTTYSKLWGYRRAGTIALILNAAIAATAVSTLLSIGVAWYWALLYLTGHLFLAWPLVQYLQAKKLGRPMKDWAEYLILWVVGYLTLVSWVA